MTRPKETFPAELMVPLLLPLDPTLTVLLPRKVVLLFPGPWDARRAIERLLIPVLTLPPSARGLDKVFSLGSLDRCRLKGAVILSSIWELS